MKYPQASRARRGTRAASASKSHSPRVGVPVTPNDFSAELSAIIELAQRVSDDSEGQNALEAQLSELPTDWRDKVTMLMNLGRAAHEQGHVYSSASAEASQMDVLALCDKHTRGQQYLERGLALLFARGADLEHNEAASDPASKRSVFERAWSHFGRELARSEPSEWRWFAHRSARAGRLEKLYLQRGDGAWWSFAAGLDRPLASHIGSARARSMRARQGDHGSSLQSLVTHACGERTALRRAMRSIHGRLGIMSDSGAAKADTL